MTAEELGRYLGKIQEAPNIGELAKLEREIVSAHAAEPETPRVLGMLSLKWKRLEAAN